VIVHGAELLVPAAVPILHRRLARALAGADIILPVSRFTAGKVRSLLSSAGLDAPPIDLLRARVDLDRFHPDAVSDLPARLGIAGRPLVLVLGRLVRRKGIDRLIEAMPEVARRVPGAILVVAGTGPRGDSLRRLSAHAVAPVNFVGGVPHEDAPGLYASATVFAMPAADRWLGLDAEGLGVVLLEAQACATPCVTGRSGGTPEAVLDGVTGFVVDGRDRGALIDRVVALLTDAGLRASMGAAARDHVRTEFSERRLPPALIDWLSSKS
jgi:phosphatidylinositol alpha-1,6-mannosyltransferase